MNPWPPRFRLTAGPTPLQEASRLRAVLGGAKSCPRIFIKRDDLCGPAMSGNKARKLEFLVAEAVAQDATVLVTTGAAQSNHARLTAAAACLAGLSSALVLSAPVARPAVEGNLLLDQLLGAEIRIVAGEPAPVLDEQHPEIVDTLRGLRARGERPYFIPEGGSTPLGALGYVAFTLELLTQLEELDLWPSKLYYPSGSRGTQAGLELGAAVYNAGYRPYGIAVSAGDPEKTKRAVAIATGAATILGLPTQLEGANLITDQRFFGAGYGISTPASVEATRLVARTEAVLLDPVYTAKAMSALISHVRTGELRPDTTVIFLHTGGVPAVFGRSFAL